MADLNDIFAPNWSGCCGMTASDITDFQHIWMEYYMMIFSRLDGLTDNMYQSGIYGHSDENQDTTDNVNDYHYLFFYLYFIRQEMNGYYYLYSIGNIDSYPSMEEIAEQYSLDCIRKYFACQGHNIMPIYSLFGLNWLTEESKDGIAYMAVVPNTTNSPDNRVS